LAPPSAAPVPVPSVTAAPLRGRCIWVVEDDLAVLGGLQVLLASWGADVLAFASHAEVTSAMTCPPAGPSPAKPDLLIVDYRLEGGHHGIEVIERVRQHVGRLVPSIVVSGSTLSGLEDLAEQHDFQLLIKPVVPARLRSVVNFKLSVRAPAASAPVTQAGTPA
jgi:CheY-like chemotaxis protein